MVSNTLRLALLLLLLSISTTLTTLAQESDTENVCLAAVDAAIAGLRQQMEAKGW